LIIKLRAATSEAERSTLQNVVTATDEQIDQLVYELYGLKPEEIAPVEGAA
jgi:lambda repressor-like predicted transcriptional regulator